MQRRILIVVFALSCVLLGAADCGEPKGNSGFSTELPDGTVTSKKLEKSGPSGKFYEICVRSEINSRGWEKGEVYCKGERKEKEVKNCNDNAKWPTCRTK